MSNFHMQLNNDKNLRKDNLQTKIKYLDEEITRNAESDE